MTEIRHSVPDDLYAAWRQTVPRGQPIRDRIARLMLADLAGDAAILDETVYAADLLDDDTELDAVIDEASLREETRAPQQSLLRPDGGGGGDQR